jgi:hypothetical protein
LNTERDPERGASGPTCGGRVADLDRVGFLFEQRISRRPVINEIGNLLRKRFNFNRFYCQIVTRLSTGSSISVDLIRLSFPYARTIASPFGAHSLSLSGCFRLPPVSISASKSIRAGLKRPRYSASNNGFAAAMAKMTPLVLNF